MSHKWNNIMISFNIQPMISQVEVAEVASKLMPKYRGQILKWEPFSDKESKQFYAHIKSMALLAQAYALHSLSCTDISIIDCAVSFYKDTIPHVPAILQKGNTKMKNRNTIRPTNLLTGSTRKGNQDRQTCHVTGFRPMSRMTSLPLLSTSDEISQICEMKYQVSHYFC